MIESKICSQCKQEKSINKFYKRTLSKDGLSSSCKPCHNDIDKRSLRKRLKLDPTLQLRKNKWARDLYVKNPEKFKARSKNRTWEQIRNVTLKYKFGISLDVYLNMLEAQNGVCLICGNSQPQLENKKYNSLLCVDHNHKTGKIRGLLCRNCNAAIGLLKDSSILLESAYKYLKSFGD